MSGWRFYLGGGCLIAFGAVAGGIEWWRLALSAGLLVTGVWLIDEAARRDERRRCERDAWVRKVVTAYGSYLQTGPIVYVKPDTVGPPYPVTALEGEPDE